MLKNGKLFIPRPNERSDFKELFKRLVAAGAGRPLGSDGFPAGPWTPELLAEAISQIDSNRVGVDLRTVQLWFQDNEKGISNANIRWLARIFGCDDPVATNEWQIELSEAQSRFTAKRREAKNAKSSASVAPAVPGVAWTATVDDVTGVSAELARETDIKRPEQRPGLALRSEAIFSRGSPLNLPASVFAGATALGFLSYITGIHSATYVRADGVAKQVGFLWAPNWTFLFMVLLPLFFSLVTELLVFWKGEGRLKLLAQGDKMESDHDWGRIVEASSYSYWAVFLICVLFAGLFQWIGVCLVPLIKGGADYATSWGTLAVVRPEIISVPMSIVFTALAYLYMCLCFYLFFVGLILLHTMVHDLSRIEEASKTRPEVEYRHERNELGLRLMRGIFRCTVLGVLVAICMKAQSAYLASNRENIVAWFVGDMSSALHHQADVSSRFSYRMPTHYSSLLVAISTCVVFLYGSIRLGGGSRFQVPLWKMSAVVAFLFASYLLIDAFTGFSILLGIGMLFGIYGLCDPGFGHRERVR
ncbi:hypothetical protein G6K88_31420 [Agrobacterium rhizogenes]|uniref:RcgA family putative transporter n=1 Tax=Rhizobium rhizogenes TaxID=359 RepID=UPI00115E1A6A|nr:hypothetical protein [Rhizobium rhizogenes]NTI13355.1 hypothetical protein [Rhizobium rhizogenes]TRB16732.1 hypothetical protein EXN70_31930 [Rhizobium rhizogenes]